MAAIEPVTFHWQGISREIGEIALREAQSTFRLSAEQRRAAENFWKTVQERNPGKYWNGQLWRYESLTAESRLEIAASPVMYHFYHYKQENLRTDFIFPNPNPLGVTPLQITIDGYVLAGIQEFAGRNMLTLIGSGFVERGRKDRIIDTLERELAEETAYPKGFTPQLEKAAAISVMTGKGLHTTGICVYVPLPLEHKETGIRGGEHKEYVPIPARELNEILSAGNYKGLSASHQLLGALETYMLLEEHLKQDRRQSSLTWPGIKS